MSELIHSAEYERGRVDALLEEHTARLNKINGSIEHHARSNEDLARAISTGLERVGNEMRKIQEEVRARDLAAEVAKKTLAAETERRRKELSDLVDANSNRWSVLDHKAGVFVAITAIGALAVSLLNALHTIFS